MSASLQSKVELALAVLMPQIPPGAKLPPLDPHNAEMFRRLIRGRAVGARVLVSWAAEHGFDPEVLSKEFVDLLVEETGVGSAEGLRGLYLSYSAPAAGASS